MRQGHEGLPPGVSRGSPSRRMLPGSLTLLALLLGFGAAAVAGARRFVETRR